MPLRLLLALLPAAAVAAPDPLERWIDARAREHEAHASAGASRGGAQALFRVRPPGEALPPGFEPPRSLAPLIRAIRSGVVNISTVNVSDVRGAGPAQVARRSLGSGFILSPDGHVVTNNHVVANARQIRVTLADGRQFLAEVVGRDPSTDVALLRLVGDDVRDLPFTYLGDSDELEVGDWVLAIGNPFGLDHSVAHGMISAKERVLGIGVFDDFIQTDALINPGNSGGPLFNMRGEVVGVNTAIISQGQGIGFAVPINMVKDLLPNLRVNGRLARGWLGVNIGEAQDASAAVVTQVFPGSPAADAGIRPGDRVLSVNGRPIETYLQLLRRVAILAPGTEARLTLLRGDRQLDVAVRLGERPAADATLALDGPGHAEKLGLIVQDVSGATAEGLGLTPHSGVLVTGIVPGTPAHRAGLQPGDLVTEVNRQAVKDVRSFRRALGEPGRGRSVLIRFQRGADTRYVALDPG